MERKPLSKRIRFEVFKSDNFTCRYCGRNPPSIILHVDHVLPVSDGGTNDRENLITSCSDCNFGKSNIPLNRIINSPSKEDLVERRIQLKAFKKWILTKQLLKEENYQKISKVLMELSGINHEKNHWAGQTQSSLKTLLERLPVDEMIESAHYANSRFGFDKNGNQNRAFLYFWGTCWGKIRDKGAICHKDS